MNIRFELWDKKKQKKIYPDRITFHLYGHFTFEVFTEEGKKLGTDEDFDLVICTIEDSMEKRL